MEILALSSPQWQVVLGLGRLLGCILSETGFLNLSMHFYHTHRSGIAKLVNKNDVTGFLAIFKEVWCLVYLSVVRRLWLYNYELPLS